MRGGMNRNGSGGSNGNGTGSGSRGGRPLDQPFRQELETTVKADLSAVRIYEGHEATRLGAVAFTRGHDIYFAPGRYDPTTREGQEIIAHEAWHVVQQQSGPKIPDVSPGVIDVPPRADSPSSTPSSTPGDSVQR